jgi:hypothetical protein
MNWFDSPLRNAERKVGRVIEQAAQKETTKSGGRIWHKGEKRGGLLKKGERLAESNLITKENASAMVRKRWDKAREAAAQGMMEAVNEKVKELDETGKVSLFKTPPEAVKEVVKHATRIYLNSKSPKGMSDLGAFLMKSTGMNREKEDETGLTKDGIVSMEEANFILQVNNYYGSEFVKPKEEDIIDGTCN